MLKCQPSRSPGGLSAQLPTKALSQGAQTPLSSAILGGHRECARLLLQAGASTTLRVEVRRNKTQTTTITFFPCITQPSRAACPQGEHTPLMLACGEGLTGCVEELLAAGAAVAPGDNVRKITTRPAPLLSWCVLAEMMKPFSLVPDQCGETALHKAAQYGHAACVRLLLAAGAPTNARTLGGKTPLFSAVPPLPTPSPLPAANREAAADAAGAGAGAEIDHVGCLRALLEAGADPRVLDTVRADADCEGMKGSAALRSVCARH